MRISNYKLTPDDIETLIKTLSVMLLNDFGFEDSDEQSAVNNLLCTSSIQKLSSGIKDFQPDEIRVMYVSLLLADNILKGYTSADDESKQLIQPYIFSINKLLPVFDKCTGDYMRRHNINI